MTDRQLLQQALDALESAEVDGNCYYEATELLRTRLAHCDRCGKKLGGEGDIHTCTPKADPIGDAQDRLIAEMAAQPEQEPVAEVVWGAKTGFEWKFKMLVELACVEDVPVKLYAGPFSGAALYWHDTETDKGTTPPAAPAQPELVQELQKQLRDALGSLDFYRRRIEVLQQWQSKMRDPERIIVCDILANGHTLEPAGDRYTPPAAQRTWVELTDDEISHMWRNSPPASHDFARAIEQRLKENNT
jgi:hypothetical protein